MFSIIVNGVNTKIGNPLPAEVSQLEIKISKLSMAINIPKLQTPLVKLWLEELADKLTCDYVTYNNVLVKVSELEKKFR